MEAWSQGKRIDTIARFGVFRAPVPIKLSNYNQNDAVPIDAVDGTKSWDRRRRGAARANAILLLERAAAHLIHDQMAEGRIFYPGAMDALHLLRKSVASIEADELMYQRAGRAVASWLPKHVLARQYRDGISDA